MVVERKSGDSGRGDRDYRSRSNDSASPALLYRVYIHRAEARTGGRSDRESEKKEKRSYWLEEGTPSSDQEEGPRSCCVIGFKSSKKSLCQEFTSIRQNRL